MKLSSQMLCAVVAATLVFPFQASVQAADSPAVYTRVSIAKLELQRQADAKAIAAAFRICLRNPEVGQIVHDAVHTQVYSNKALGFVNGYWAKPVNLSAIYVLPKVIEALAKNLEGNSSALARLEAARAALESGEQVIDPDVGAAIIFIPQDVAMEEGMTDLMGFVEAIASGAFFDELGDLIEIGANDFIFALIIGVGASLIAGAILGGCDDEVDPWGPDGDPDNDGIPNKHDADDDNDGVKDTEDSHPFDPSQSMTHCPPPGLCFSVDGDLDADLSEGIMDIVGQTYTDLAAGVQMDAFEMGSGPGLVYSFPNL